MGNSKSLRSVEFPNHRRGSSASLSSAETLTCGPDYPTYSSEAGDEPEYLLGSDITAESVVHAIIVPNYKEEMDTLRETLEVLASHPQAREVYDVNDSTPSSHIYLVTRLTYTCRSI